MEPPVEPLAGVTGAAAAGGATTGVAAAATTLVAMVVAWPSAKTPGFFGALEALEPPVVFEPEEPVVGVEPDEPPEEPPVEPPVDGVLGVLGALALPGPEPQEPCGALSG